MEALIDEIFVSESSTDITDLGDSDDHFAYAREDPSQTGLESQDESLAVRLAAWAWLRLLFVGKDVHT